MAKENIALQMARAEEANDRMGDAQLEYSTRKKLETEIERLKAERDAYKRVLGWIRKHPRVGRAGELAAEILTAYTQRASRGGA